jgi:hypothetical protein
VGVVLEVLVSQEQRHPDNLALHTLEAGAVEKVHLLQQEMVLQELSLFVIWHKIIVITEFCLMPLFDKQEHKVHFIHIPRTAGRYVSKLFESNGFETKYTQLNSDENINGIMKIHLYYPLYERLENYNERCEFCIVRHPYTRFISSMTQINQYFNHDTNYILEDQEIFNRFILDHQSVFSIHNSWFLEQHKFISSKTKIWKYEYGFGNNFLRWIYKNFNIKLEPIKNIKFNNQLWFNYKENLNNKKYQFKNTRLIKKYVKIFYKKDYDVFKYR